MRITAINSTQNQNIQPQFGTLQKIAFDSKDKVLERMAIALEDSLEFRKFCQNRDVFVEILKQHKEKEFPKPFIKILCRNLGTDNLMPKMENVDEVSIGFVGDLKAYKPKNSKNEECFSIFDTPHPHLIKDDYTNTMCGTILKMIKMKAKDFENMLANQKATKEPTTINLCE